MPGLYRTAEEKRGLEIRNGTIQFRAVLHYIEEWDRGVTRFTPAILLELHRLAINQIYTCAGSFRAGAVALKGSGHAPPEYTEVPKLVEEMCEYINASWDKPPVHLCAYLMWRINWIHPFFGGNGRTARAASYLVLCASLNFRLPGEKTIPDLIVDDRDPYYDALQSADKAWNEGRLDISQMEGLVSDLLAKQLVMVHNRATGGDARRDAPR